MAGFWEKDEYKNSKKWIHKSRHGNLNVIPCISGWIDICGFGTALEKCAWDLSKLQDSGLITLLNDVYQTAARPFLVGVEPAPYESILVINDGISRTVDLGKPEFAHAPIIIFYLRDLFVAHRNLMNLTRSYGYGIRTVFAGGERVQYSPESYTGNMFLQYNEENITDYGKALLNKNFLHNPSEFQMNTAFAKAYSVDSLGSKHGFKVNNCYVEKTFWQLINSIPMINIEKKGASILIKINDMPAIEIYFGEQINTSFKGINMSINQVIAIRIDKDFEGEDTYIDITMPPAPELNPAFGKVIDVKAPRFHKS
ncbi:hypothetical protein [Aeromonas hydrophila]|uniref:Uncharacterized protein n=1 Tax=Aeromonas hydrophila subsp. hydrophila (strain ATCC 7966 / DSM 30187 / BCRC 13018 / CCUG 14551 / JCM 1027 / KCTC 2358 / NCIMB 9240 / NCTC 8049) TaxID=380703 RepID=A0KHT2_AERHH|nr:hypothetical protein [Aeromonas hydrophila]ABK36446.1 hypothetical protein AHA_1292 [Aeromonas hydrophila subsp. hydrophila ATCC 7966]MBS4670502.1 hypothetical protein [Aeromonas hydrophila]SUU23113.1 Uncharacterised protein [Aeromonas hydrophila]